MAPREKTKFPKDPGACVDLIYTLDGRIKTLKRDLETLEEQRKELAKHTQNAFNKKNITGAKTKLAMVEFVPKIRYNADDWNKIYAFVAKNKAFDLIQRRLSDKAVKDRIEDGVKIPGVKPFAYFHMSVKKKPRA